MKIIFECFLCSAGCKRLTCGLRLNKVWLDISRPGGLVSADKTAGMSSVDIGGDRPLLFFPNTNLCICM